MRDLCTDIRRKAGQPKGCRRLDPLLILSALGRGMRRQTVHGPLTSTVRTVDLASTASGLAASLWRRRGFELLRGSY